MAFLEKHQETGIAAGLPMDGEIPPERDVRIALADQNLTPAVTITVRPGAMAARLANCDEYHSSSVRL